MSNTRNIALVVTAAALSITLAAALQDGPSLLTDHRPMVPGLSNWAKSQAQVPDAAATFVRR